MTLRDLEPTRFVDRHVGPDPAEQAAMLDTLGLGSLDELADATVPAAIRADEPLALPAAADETAALAGAARPRRPQQGAHLADRHRVLEHRHAAGHPAQRAREPGLVHRVHAVPARDLPGPARGAPELPDDGRRPHRHGARQRVAARRGDRGAEAMALLPPAQRVRPAPCSWSTPTATRRRSRSCAPAPSRSASRWPRRRPGRGRRPRSGCFGVLLQYPGPAARSATTRDLIDAAPRRRRAGRGRRRPARLHAAASRPARWAPTSSSARRSGSACRWASAAPTPAFLATRDAHKRTLPGRLVGVSVDDAGRPALPPRPPDPRAAHPPREGHQQHLHRPGAARRHRRPLRGVPRPRRAAPDRGPGAPPRRHPRRRPDRRAESTSARRAASTPSPCGCRAGPTRSSPPPGPAASTCAGSTPTRSASRSTRRPPRRSSPTVWAAFGVTGDVDVLDATVDDTFPRAAPARPAPTSPTRSSARTTPRPRCCATCAASPTATSPSTAP